MTGAKRRIERLRQAMRDAQIDALVCLKPQNTFYLSGFNPIIYSHPVVAILPVDGEPVLLVHALRDDHARQEAWVTEIRLFGAWSTKQTMGPDWLAALHRILTAYRLDEATLGIEGDFLPTAIMHRMKDRLPQAGFADASALLMEARTIKDQDEVEAIRMAAQIADVGMDAALRAVAERRSEREISVRAMEAMNLYWLDRLADVEVADFGTLEGGVHNGLWCYCLVGDRVALNCDNPTLRTPREGELVLVVIWTTVNGLHAENERTVAVGTLDPARQRAFEAVLEIRAETQEVLRPGTVCADVYHTARRAYERLGYSRYLPGRIGHGMGLGPHEEPSLGPLDHTVLRPGMVVTFEPNLRIPEWGGLQHSDTVLITETGFEFLTHTRRDLVRV